MPNKKYSPEENKTIDKFVKNLSIGIPGPESSSSSNPYNAQNPNSSAAGKYQFLDDWLDHDKGIKQFAKANGFSVPNNMEDFKSNPVLQDSYFRYYAREVLYPEAKAIHKANPNSGLRLDEVGALVHYKGEPSARKQITSQKYDKAYKKGENGATESNMGSLPYLKAYNQPIEKAGLESINNQDLLNAGIISSKTKNEVIQEFISRSKIIDEGDTTRAEKEVLRKQLYDDISKAGNAEIVNDYIDRTNAEDEYEHNKAVAEREEVKDILNKTHFYYNEDLKKGTKKFSNKNGYIDLNNLSKEEIKRLRELSKKYDWLSAKPTSGFNVNSKKALEDFKGKHKALTGKDLEVNPNEISLDKWSNFFETGGLGNERVGNYEFDGYDGKFKAKANVQPPSEPRSEQIQKVIDNQQEETPDPEKEEDPKEEKETIAETENDGLAMEFLRNQEQLDSLNQDNFNYQPGKRDLPIDAVMGLAMGIIGDEQAKNANIPLRTEDVNQAFKSYVAELAERSKQGLPVEVEAQMKNMLADAYQGGLNSIVRASAGNRATVLGNLGSLEQAKSKGLMNMAIADFEAKDRAFAQYGDAIKYINEFEARRDIANHGIKYKEAKEKQMQGRALAVTGMQKLTEALRYDKENGPGSANDMYRSLLMQKSFGFDPKMKDDGSGTVPGTKSFYDKQKATAYERSNAYSKVKNLVAGMNEEQRAKMDEAVTRTQDPNMLFKIGETIVGGMHPDNIDLNKMNEANKSGDVKALINPNVETFEKTFNQVDTDVKPATFDGLQTTSLTAKETEPVIKPVTLPTPNVSNNSVQLPEPNLNIGIPGFENIKPVELPEPDTDFINKYDPFGALKQ